MYTLILTLISPGCVRPIWFPYWTMMVFTMYVDPLRSMLLFTVNIRLNWLMSSLIGEYTHLAPSSLTVYSCGTIFTHWMLIWHRLTGPTASLALLSHWPYCLTAHWSYYLTGPTASLAYCLSLSLASRCVTNGDFFLTKTTPVVQF